MKTTLSKAQSYKLPSGKTVQIPDGLKVIRATNLPEDSGIKFWLDELTPAMMKDRETESHFRCYGFGFGADEVTELSEYDQQAESFLASHGLKFRATLSDSKTPAWSEGEKCGHHYRVTISRTNIKKIAGLPYAMVTSGHASLRNSARLAFDFFGSIADAEKGIVTVKPYDVLACISADAYTPATFADFCAEYGYEEDSIKALQMFRRCDRFAKRLRAFFTEQELTDLSEIR